MHGERRWIAHQGLRREGPADAAAEEPAGEGAGGQIMTYNVRTHKLDRVDVDDGWGREKGRFGRL